MALEGFEGFGRTPQILEKCPRTPKFLENHSNSSKFLYRIEFAALNDRGRAYLSNKKFK